jgi:5-hydroxyisourate hydrolase
MGLSTHVLDTTVGRPAARVPVRLERAKTGPGGGGAGGSGGPVWTVVASAVTDSDGRVRDLPAHDAGVWRLVFDTAARSAFFPEVAITFVVTDPAEHHHVPLLLAPYGYSTYRGS